MGTWAGLYCIEQAPPFPGDCDGDAEISIGEVQRAINEFILNLTPLCGLDRDGDGSVSIGEVQTVINGFLGLVDACTSGKYIQ